VTVAFCAGLLRTIVIARFLGPAEIGLMGIAVLALGFVEAVTSSGVDTALQAERSEIEPYLDPAFTIQLARGFVVFLMLWIAAPTLAWAFDNEAAVNVIRAVAAIAPIRGAANPAVALVVRRLDFRRVFWWSLPEVLSSLCLAVLLVSLRRDVWALVVASVAAQTTGTAASYGMARRRPRLCLQRESIRSLLRFGRFVSGSRALMYFSVNLDAAAVGVALGTRALGLYQFAIRVAELPVVTFTKAAAQVVLPAVSGARTSEALARTWRAMLAAVVGVNVAAAAVILLFAGRAVAAVAPGWLDAVPLMHILAVGMVFRAVIVLAGQLLDGVGHPARTVRLNAERLALLVVLLPVLMWRTGLTGVALAVVVTNAGAAVRAVQLAARVEQETPEFPD
jgi:O-antigen/teichoic acid export membrane protein